MKPNLSSPRAELITYRWLARDPLDCLRQGDLQAVHARAAKLELQGRGLRPVLLWRRASLLPDRLNPRSLAHFSHQFAALLSAGLPVLRALEVIAAGENKPKRRQLWCTLHAAIGEGHSLCEAMQRHNRIFDALYCGLIQVGEHSGQLEHVLQTLADHQLRQAALQARLRQALSYPALLALTAIVVLGLLLGFVVPVFQQSFAAAGASLPAPTRLVIGAAEWARHELWMAIPLFFGLSITIRLLYRRQPQRFYPLLRWRLRLPWLGRLLKAAASARASHSLSLSLQAGLPLLLSLTLAAEASGNAVFRRALQAARGAVATGHSLEESLRASGLFAPLAMQLIAVGEVSGTLTHMLGEIAAHEETFLREQLELLAPLLEPLLMLSLGSLVAGVLIALYLPIFQLASLF